MIYLILIISVIIIALLHSSLKDKAKDSVEGVIYSDDTVNYLNGFPEISGGEYVKVKVLKDKMKIIFPSRKLTKEIFINNIIDAESSTEEQIQKDISLGRLIVFGLLAFGLKKESKGYKKYAVINYIDNNKQRTLILETTPDMMIKTIIDLKSNNI